MDKNEWLNNFINNNYLRNQTENSYSLHQISFNESLDKAILHFHVECGNGYIAPMVVKENGTWRFEG